MDNDDDDSSWNEAVRLPESLDSEYSHCGDHASSEITALRSGCCSCEHWLLFTFKGIDDARPLHPDLWMNFLDVLFVDIDYHCYFYNVAGKSKYYFIVYIADAKAAVEASNRLSMNLGQLESTYGGTACKHDNPWGSVIDFDKNYGLLSLKKRLSICTSCCFKQVLSFFCVRNVFGRSFSLSSSGLKITYASSNSDFIEKYMGRALMQMLNREFVDP